ncbi:MAG: thioesterase domain-containing protein [Chloroflexi bacterium]|nr:thioesterase domain-containing protein [Chloroflexota bacterium]MCI0578422.1 thioesterase domain-containing protein [Chloroflexota bacterium]MCI0648162.1 thioesterase domain-containing protein [Chloroflexota bacterium]MCI0726677.1 thioesterase domain-containing protein [Chloroflexota bacterium]
MTNQWIVSYNEKPGAQLHLFCFPSAGSSATQFFPWAGIMPPGLQMHVVKLPGRENRFREPLFIRLGPLVEALADGLHSLLYEPFAFLGHSLGALIAFELTRLLRRQAGSQPVHLFLAARRAPHLPSPPPLIHQLPDDKLVAWLRDLGGTPAQILESPEMMGLFLPIVRADMAANELYQHATEAPLAIPISCFGGEQDKEASRPELAAWRGYTTQSFQLRLYPGGHFFLNDARTSMVWDVAADLALHLR